jgi:hypothetical protein
LGGSYQELIGIWRDGEGAELATTTHEELMAYLARWRRS